MLSFGVADWVTMSFIARVNWMAGFTRQARLPRGWRGSLSRKSALAGPEIPCSTTLPKNRVSRFALNMSYMQRLHRLCLAQVTETTYGIALRSGLSSVSYTSRATLNLICTSGLVHHAPQIRQDRPTSNRRWPRLAMMHPRRDN